MSYMFDGYNGEPENVKRFQNKSNRMHEPFIVAKLIRELPCHSKVSNELTINSYSRPYLNRTLALSFCNAMLRAPRSDRGSDTVSPPLCGPGRKETSCNEGRPQMTLKRNSSHARGYSLSGRKMQREKLTIGNGA